MARMTATSNANLIQDVFHAKRFIEALRETLVALPLATKEIAQQGAGDTVRWQYFANPSAATTALSQGADPTSPTDLSTTAVTAELAEYGAYFEPAKLFLHEAASGTKEEIVKAAGYQAAITLDTLCFTQSLQDASNTNDAGTGMTADDIATAVAELSANSARPHPITPGGRFYCGILSDEAAYDMMNEGTPAWSTVKDDDLRAALVTPFDGTEATSALYNCIIKISQNVQRDTSTSPDDDLNYIVAKDAFGAVSIDGNMMSPRVIITNPEERTDKPLRNSGTIGWWVAFVSELIDSNRVVEITSDATGVG